MDYLTEIPGAEPARQPRRRVHSPAFKAHLVALCQDSATSVAAIARAHNINDNMLHRWIREAQAKTPATPSFITLPTSAEVARPVQQDRAGPYPGKAARRKLTLKRHKPKSEISAIIIFDGGNHETIPVFVKVVGTSTNVRF
ncbi:transposase [Advenella sp. EE-W14]|uniref:transposase n=1 Tax=Advenella sp. EE-W14 TaxID=2722705 RepID=UPI00145D5652